MNTNVALLKIFPGINEGFVNAVLNAPGIEAVVLETFGSGNAPTSEWFLKAIEKAVSKGLLILNVTQCLAGSVEMVRYATGIKLHELGVLSGFDITTESAITKLMFLLEEKDSKKEIEKFLNMSLKGEINI